MPILITFDGKHINVKNMLKTCQMALQPNVVIRRHATHH